MKLAFSGHRDKIANWWQIKEIMNTFNSDGNLIVVHGGAIGFDTQVSKVAKRLGIKEEVHKPDWNTFGKSAGYRRNKTIVDSSDTLVVLWDRRTKGGTFQALNYALEKDKTIYYLDIMKDYVQAREKRK
jgi:uncharacterized phage-like protein YoqJ